MASFFYFVFSLLLLGNGSHLAFADISPPRRLQLDPSFSSSGAFSAPSLWLNGRTFGGDSPLARHVADHPDEYWSQLSGQLMGHVAKKSQEVSTHWQTTVEKNGDLKAKVSAQCFNVLKYMIQHPIEEEWSAKMIDSMGSLPSGLLSTTVTSLGDFDQCLAIDGAHGGAPFVGKYCLARVNLPRTAYQAITFNGSLLATPPWTRRYLQRAHHLDNRFSLASALCFPSLCKQTEIREILQSYYPILHSFEFNVTFCQSRDDPPEYDQRIWIALALLSYIASLVLLAFAVDLFLSPSDAESPLWRQLFSCFSPVENTTFLFHQRDTTAPESGQFQFAHGIRALGSLFIVLAHASSLYPAAQVTVLPYARLIPTYQARVRMFPFQPFLNGAAIVHVFFTLSGLVFTYHSLSPTKPKQSFFSHILLRWLRFLPATIGMLALTVSLELLGSGPLFHRQLLKPILDSCYDYGWANLLFIHNFLLVDLMGIPSTWSLAAEMHLHAAAYLLLIVYPKSSRMTYLLSGSFIALQGLYTVAVLLSGLGQPTLLHFIPFALDSNIFPSYLWASRILFHFTPNSMIPYFTGTILGQILHEKKVFTFSKLTTRLLWTLSFLVLVFFFTNTYLPMQTFNPETDSIFFPGSLTIALLVFIVLLANSLSIGWIFYQCAVDTQNAVSRFLSAAVFQPLSRLSFSLLFVHMALLWFLDLQTRSPLPLAGYSAWWQMASSSLLLSLVFGYFFFLAFDAPTVRLIKMLIKRSQQAPVKEPLDKNSNVREGLEERMQKKII